MAILPLPARPRGMPSAMLRVVFDPDPSSAMLVDHQTLTINHTSLVFHPPTPLLPCVSVPSVVTPQPSAFCLQSSVLNHPSFTFRAFPCLPWLLLSLLSSDFCLLSSVFCLLPSAFCLLSSVFCLLPSSTDRCKVAR
jgi:hypothetical protein